MLKGLFRIGWAFGVVAPWCLGAVLSVSISADAGQDVGIGGSIVPPALRAAPRPIALIPVERDESVFKLLRVSSAPRLAKLRFAFAGPERSATPSQEAAPRAVLKAGLAMGVGRAPAINRSEKGNPTVALPSSFDLRLRQRGGLARWLAADLMFDPDGLWPRAAFSLPQSALAVPSGASAFEPWPAGESPTTVASSATASPQQGVSAVTMRPAAINRRLIQGASPAVPRAASLASTTPAPADLTPIEVYAAATLPRNMPVVPVGRRKYAALVGHEHAGRELHCLAEAIYFEARGEPLEGQAAVAQVVLNRVASGLYPSTICAVVFQNRWRYDGCQFSFACDGRSLRITEPDAWRTAIRLAKEVSDGQTYVADVGDATHYHATYVRPRWARRLRRVDRIGHHIFYELRPGQT